jgi:hypothetical protein
MLRYKRLRLNRKNEGKIVLISLSLFLFEIVSLRLLE